MAAPDNVPTVWDPITKTFIAQQPPSYDEVMDASLDFTSSSETPAASAKDGMGYSLARSLASSEADTAIEMLLLSRGRILSPDSWAPEKSSLSTESPPWINKCLARYRKHPDKLLTVTDLGVLNIRSSCIETIVPSDGLAYTTYPLAGFRSEYDRVVRKGGYEQKIAWKPTDPTAILSELWDVIVAPYETVTDAAPKFDKFPEERKALTLAILLLDFCPAKPRHLKALKNLSPFLMVDPEVQKWVRVNGLLSFGKYTLFEWAVRYIKEAYWRFWIFHWAEGFLQHLQSAIVLLAAHSMRIVVSSRGYIRVVHQSVQSNDHIAVLGQCELPVILRPAEQAEDGRKVKKHRFVGEMWAPLHLAGRENAGVDGWVVHDLDRSYWSEHEILL